MKEFFAFFQKYAKREYTPFSQGMWHKENPIEIDFKGLTSTLIFA